MNKIYIGNLAYKVTQNDLLDHFSQFGEVLSATVITDRETGRSKGFGFVEFDTNETANSAIEKSNGVELLGRPIRVAIATKKERD